jgi:DNA adenine methylase
MTTSVTSVIRWAGSKRKILPKLREHYERARPTGKYIEPFAGSAALFFELLPRSGVLGDTNEELVAALRRLRDEPKKLFDEVNSIPTDENTYYSVRSGDLNISSEARFFYLNRLCFNGIYRTNKAGRFNVPYGAAKAGRVPPLSRWVQCSEALRSADIVHGDFEKIVLDNVAHGDFVYLDPPYAVSNRRIFKQYSASEFGMEDVKRLSDLLSEISRRGAKFVVSYAQSPETEIISSGWKVSRTFAQRNVAGFAKHRRRAVEIQISNF